MKAKILVLTLMVGLTSGAMAQSGGLPVQNQTLSPQNLSSNNLNFSATNGLDGTNGAASGNGLNGMVQLLAPVLPPMARARHQAGPWSGELVAQERSCLDQGK
jgi:hypothetical protein